MAVNLFLSAGNLVIFQTADMEIGDRIRRERRAAGLTQEQLADRIGVDKSAVGQWESPNSRKGITTENLLKVAGALAIGVERLTSDNDARDRLETTDPREITLVRLYRLMTPIQKDAHLKLFHASTGIAEPSEPVSNPSNSRRIAG